jgi:acyl-CoA thioester hydrolase
LFISETEVEVRYAETDAMQVVYHGQYVVWFEIGRTRLIKDLGFSYADMEKAGFVSPVVDIGLSYKRPFRYGETAKVRTWIEAHNGIRTTYGYEIANEKGDVCVIGSSVHTVVNKDTFRPVKFKKEFPEWHNIYEQEKKPV